MTPARKAACAALFFFPSVGAAGDLAELPKDNAELQKKISAFIRPGDSDVDARQLLETNGFQCQARTDGDGPYLLCTRSDLRGSVIQQRYQVLLQLSGRSVARVKATTGLMGP